MTAPRTAASRGEAKTHDPWVGPHPSEKRGPGLALVARPPWGARSAPAAAGGAGGHEEPRGGLAPAPFG